MKIGIDASRANSINKTGTEWYSYFLIQELKKIIPEKYKVILYSKKPLQNGLGELPTNWENKVLKWPPKFLWTQVRMSLEMLKFWSKPKVLFVPAHTIPLIHPKKTILVTHDIGFEKIKELYGDKDIGSKNNFYRNFLKFLVKFFTLGKYGNTELDYHRFAMRFAVKKAHHIITISNFSKKEICDFYNFSKNKISVVHNGFANSTYKPLKNKKLEKYKITLEKYKIKKPYILFIGRLEIKKNIPNLIKAFAILKNKYKISHKLILVGSAGFKYENIKKNIHKLNLKEEVIEPGYVEQKDINVLMNMSDLFLLPSLYEGFGIPILEAMSAGIPVACSNIEPLQEVGGQAAYYFNPTDKEEIARIIFKALTNHNLRAKLIKNGFKQIEKFSYKKCAKETWNILEKNI